MWELRALRILGKSQSGPAILWCLRQSRRRLTFSSVMRLNHPTGQADYRLQAQLNWRFTYEDTNVAYVAPMQLPKNFSLWAKKNILTAWSYLRVSSRFYASAITTNNHKTIQPITFLLIKKDIMTTERDKEQANQLNKTLLYYFTVTTTATLQCHSEDETK